MQSMYAQHIPTIQWQDSTSINVVAPLATRCEYNGKFSGTDS
jgi:hypothetical protein